MLDERLINRTYYLYKCTSIRSDETTIERVFKIQSFFNVEDLAIALLLMNDNLMGFKSCTLTAGDYESGFDDQYEKIYPDCFTFADLDEEKNMIIKFTYQDGKSIQYICEYIGFDIQSKKIARTLPICVCARGYSMLSHSEYIQSQIGGQFSMTYDNYYVNEDTSIKWALSLLKRLFNGYKESFYEMPEPSEVK